MVKQSSAPSPKRRTREESIERIQNAMLEQIELQGYSRVSVNKIAKTANVNISLLYRYFPDGKISIMLSLVERFINSAIEENKQARKLRNNAEMPNDIQLATLIRNDPLQFLKNFLQKYVKMHRKNEILLTSLTAAYLGDKEIFSDEDIAVITSSNAQVSFIAQILRGFNYDQPDILEKSKFLFDVIDALTHRHIIIKPISDTDEELAERLTNLFLAYIK